MEVPDSEDDDTVRFVDERITELSTQSVIETRALQRAQRTRSYSCCEHAKRSERTSSFKENYSNVERRPRSNSEPLIKGSKWKSQTKRAQEVRFLTPFSQKELDGLSAVIAGDSSKMQPIDLDFIGLPAHACRKARLGDLEEETEECEQEIEDLRLSHFEKALGEGRLKIKSDRIWRYKKHRKSPKMEPVEEWLYNNNDVISEAFPCSY